MYTVVLMVSLSTAPELPDHHRRQARGGRGHSSCYGGGYGCYGGGYGCYGGGYGGGYGGYGYGCSGGGMPVGYGCYGGGFVSYGCSGGGMPVGPGGYQQQQQQQGDKTGTEEEKKGTEEEMKKGTEEEKKGVSGPTPARLLVVLPDDARLQINGSPTASTSSVRQFSTPPLQPGHNYYYDLTAEVTRNGVPVQTTQRVHVRAGVESRVTLSFPAASLVRR